MALCWFYGGFIWFYRGFMVVLIVYGNLTIPSSCNMPFKSKQCVETAKSQGLALGYAPWVYKLRLHFWGC